MRELNSTSPESGFFSEYDNQAEGFRTRTKAAIELDNLLAQATSVIGRFSHAAPVEMSGFESLQREIENVRLRVQNLVLHYESLKLTHPEKTRTARQTTFLNWTWCMAALYSEAGGKVTLTKPGSGGLNNHHSRFFSFTHAMARSEKDWLGGLSNSDFGYALDRALKSLREVGIIVEGKVLRLPT